jgi:hypothetical protein
MSNERRRIVQRNYYKRRRSRVLARIKAYTKSKRGKETRKRWRIKNFISVLLHSAKKRAKKSGVEFDLVKSQIFIPKKCPVLGTKFIIGDSKNRDFSPSLDRFDNTRGYTHDNVCVISFRANYLKRDATLKEMKQIVRYMSEGKK